MCDEDGTHMRSGLLGVLPKLMSATAGPLSEQARVRLESGLDSQCRTTSRRSKELQGQRLAFNSAITYA